MYGVYRSGCFESLVALGVGSLGHCGFVELSDGLGVFLLQGFSGWDGVLRTTPLQIFLMGCTLESQAIGVLDECVMQYFVWYPANFSSRWFLRWHSVHRLSVSESIDRAWKSACLTLYEVGGKQSNTNLHPKRKQNYTLYILDQNPNPKLQKRS